MSSSLLFSRRGLKPIVDLSFLGCLPEAVTFSRASSAWAFDSAGTLTQATANVARIDHDPATLEALGLLMEEQRINGIRNNTLVGAAAGTPGTLPTNWSAVLSSGISRQVVGTGTENGIDYIDIRFYGTASAAGGSNIKFETTTQIAALTGQNWATSAFVKLASGSLANLNNVCFVLRETTSGGSTVTDGYGSATTPTSAGLATQRVVFNRLTAGGGTTAYVVPMLVIEYSNGAAIDVTLRIGLPQCEQGSFATSVIRTTGSAVTRNADSALLSPLSWFNATEGAFAFDYKSAAAAPSGATPRLLSVNNGTANNRVDVYVNGATQAVTAIMTVSGTDNVTQSLGTNNSTGINKVAVRYRANDTGGSLNGGAAAVDTACALPSVSQAQFFAEVSGNAYTGWLRRFRYWKNGISDATLQQVTL